MEVTGGGSGTAYVSWLSDSNPAGYALFLRAFSVTRGWLSGPAQITADYGSSAVWPGDTTGLSDALAHRCRGQLGQRLRRT